MTEKKSIKELLMGLIPTGLSRGGVIGLIIIAVMAFSLGSLLTGGNSEPKEIVDSHDPATAESSKSTVWTCSMHPQIKLPKPGKCPLCFMDLIPLETGDGEELDPRQIKMSEIAKQIARIETTPVIKGLAEAEIRMVGNLDYNETRVSYITAWFPGRIEKLLVNFTGITVRQGEPMAHIYSPEMIAAQEELLQAKKIVSTISNGSLILKNTARATLTAARDKLRLFGLAKNQIDKIETLDEIPDRITIRAPVSGTVIDKHVNEGMYLKTGMRLFTIADLSELWAYFDAYESDILWLKLGQYVRFTSLSFPGEIFEARIDFIDPILNPRTRTVKVRAVVNNENGRLKPEMFVSGIVKSQLDKSGNVATDDSDELPLIIPATAALLTGTRAVVYVELPSDEGSIFEGREVVLGPRAGDVYIVRSGLEEGELVVINGAFKIDAELQIRAKPSMMLPEGVGGQADHDIAIDTESSVYAFGTSERIKNHEVAQEALTPVYDSYFRVQMALADDDLDKSKSAFESLAENARAVDMSLFKGDAHVTWMKLYEKLTAESEKGSATDDIEVAREAFYSLSLATIELHDIFGHASRQEYYLTFCPMAFDYRGAYWLQTVDTIYNSFYGESMLRCGASKQKLGWGYTKGE